MSFLSSLLGGLSGALSFIPGLGVAGDVLSSVGSKVFGGMSADEQWQREAQFNAQQAQINRNFQRSERLQTQQFNLDMWNRNNAYNSPANQLKRAQDAGINPNAVINGMSPSSSSPVSSSPMSGSMASSPGSLASSMLLQDASIANLMANTRKTNAEADSTKYQLDFYKLTEPQRVQQLQKTNKKLDAEVDEIFSKIGMNDFSKDIQNKYYEWFSRQSEADLKLKSEQLNLLRNQAITEYYKRFNVQADTDLKQSESVVNQSEYVLNSAQAVNTSKNTELQNQEIKNKVANFVLTKKQIVSQEFQNIISEFAADFAQITGLPLGTTEFDVMLKLWSAGEFDNLNSLTLQKAQYNMSDNVVTAPFVGIGGALGNIMNSSLGHLKSLFNP